MIIDDLTVFLNEKSRDEIHKAVKDGVVFEIDGYYLTKQNYIEYQKLKNEEDYWDRVQQTKKVFLNALYGALLNAGFRFSDPRFGQSVTLSGRIITKHMIRKANEILNGNYDFSPDTITADTDSIFLCIKKIIEENNWTEEQLSEIVDYADELGKLVNDSFPDKMSEAFLVPRRNGEMISCKREKLARRAMFKHHTKKRYAVYVMDDEGKRKKEVKITGMETQRSDTPNHIQDFLLNLIERVLMDNWTFEKVKTEVIKYRTEMWDQDFRLLGRPTRASKISIAKKAIKRWEDDGGMGPKHRVHFAPMAALQFLKYKDYFNDKTTPPIFDGEKVIIFDLLYDIERNPLGSEKIALSTNLKEVPQWFKDLPFDIESAQRVLITSKIEGIFDMLHWKFPVSRVDDSEEIFTYD